MIRRTCLGRETCRWNLAGFFGESPRARYFSKRGIFYTRRDRSRYLVAAVTKCDFFYLFNFIFYTVSFFLTHLFLRIYLQRVYIFFFIFILPLLFIYSMILFKDSLVM